MIEIPPQSEFQVVMEGNPPRLVVAYRKIPDGDQFQWGVVGNIPLLTLIGCVVRAQGNLQRGECLPCDEMVLVIAWPSDGSTLYFANKDIPVDPMVGMLGIIHAMLVDSRLAQQQGAQKVAILGPDGQPVRH